MGLEIKKGKEILSRLLELESYKDDDSVCDELAKEVASNQLDTEEDKIWFSAESLIELNKTKGIDIEKLLEALE